MNRYAKLLHVVALFTLVAGFVLLLPGMIESFHFGMAQFAHLHGDYASAISGMERAEQKLAHSIVAKRGLALAYFRDGRYAKAIDVLSELPLEDDPETLNLLLLALQANGEWQKAVEVAEETGWYATELGIHTSAGLLSAHLLDNIPIPSAIAQSLLKRALPSMSNEAGRVLLALKMEEKANQSKLGEMFRALAVSGFYLHYQPSLTKVIPATQLNNAVAAILATRLPGAHVGENILAEKLSYEHSGVITGEMISRWSTTVIGAWQPNNAYAFAAFTTLHPASQTNEEETSAQLVEANSQGVLRIDGYVVRSHNRAQPVNGGVQLGTVDLVLGQPYLLAIRYNTPNSYDLSASVWLSSVADFFGERFLPPTNGTWKDAIFLFTSKDEAVSPLIRLWRESTLLVDSVELRPVFVGPDDPPVQGFEVLTPADAIGK